MTRYLPLILIGFGIGCSAPKTPVSGAPLHPLPTSPEMDGTQYAQRAIDFWSNQWNGWSVMGIGLQDPIFGLDSMEQLHQLIKNCPSPIQIREAGHFTQEHGRAIAEAAVRQQTIHQDR